MDIIGTMLNKSEIQEFSSGFKTQEFYLDCSTYDQNTGQKYDNILRFQVIGDKISLLTGFNKGQKIKVFFNPKGKLYEKDGKKGQVQNLNVWKIEEFALPNQQPQQTAQPQQYQQPQTNPIPEDEDDDLPF